MKIPPHRLESVYNAVAVFTLPKSSLEKNVAFHIVARDDSMAAPHAMPNAVVGYSEPIDEQLKKLY